MALLQRADRAGLTDRRGLQDGPEAVHIRLDRALTAERESGAVNGPGGAPGMRMPKSASRTRASCSHIRTLAGLRLPWRMPTLAAASSTCATSTNS